MASQKVTLTASSVVVILFNSVQLSKESASLSSEQIEGKLLFNYDSKF